MKPGTESWSLGTTAKDFDRARLAEFGGRVVARVMYCEEARHEHECVSCETFVCERCMRRWPWTFGAHDAKASICDACWAFG